MEIIYGLGDILQKYFGCQKPYKKNGTLSKDGERAYAKLVNLLSDIDELIDIDFSNKIDELDSLATSDEKNIAHFVDKWGNIVN